MRAIPIKHGNDLESSRTDKPECKPSLLRSASRLHAGLLTAALAGGLAVAACGGGGGDGVADAEMDQASELSDSPNLDSMSSLQRARSVQRSMNNSKVQQ